MGKIPKKIGKIPKKRPTFEKKEKILFPKLRNTLSELNEIKFLDSNYSYYSYKKNEIMGENIDRLINFFDIYVDENNELMDELDEFIVSLDDNYKNIVKMKYDSNKELMKKEFIWKEKFKENIEKNIINRIGENNNIIKESEEYAKERMVGSIRFINGLVDDGDILINKSEYELGEQINEIFIEYICLDEIEREFNLNFSRQKNKTLEDITTKERILYVEDKIKNFFLEKELESNKFDYTEVNSIAKIGLIKIKNIHSYLETIEGTYLLKKNNLLKFNSEIDYFYDKLDYICSNLTKELVSNRLKELGGN